MKSETLSFDFHGHSQEATAYLARVLRFEKDASLLKEAETLIETLR